MAKITISLMRELEQKVTAGEISYSKMVEILNNQASLNAENEFEYYKVKQKVIAQRGDRYFKFKWNSDHVLQICLEINNEVKKGKGHYVGIYKISRITMMSNWYPNCVESCTEQEFNEAREKAIELLK
jgi:hypothetical protein